MSHGSTWWAVMSVPCWPVCRWLRHCRPIMWDRHFGLRVSAVMRDAFALCNSYDVYYKLSVNLRKPRRIISWRSARKRGRWATSIKRIWRRHWWQRNSHGAIVYAQWSSSHCEAFVWKIDNTKYWRRRRQLTLAVSLTRPPPLQQASPSTDTPCFLQISPRLPQILRFYWLEWLSFPLNGLGGSDCPAILNLGFKKFWWNPTTLCG